MALQRCVAFNNPQQHRDNSSRTRTFRQSPFRENLGPAGYEVADRRYNTLKLKPMVLVISPPLKA
jgi:hypothetical protein